MKLRIGVLAATLGCLIAPATFAAEIVTKREIVNNILRTEHLVKVADNGIFFLDTSSSTNKVYPASGKTIAETMKMELNDRNTWFPDLGHKIGIYTYTDVTNLDEVLMKVHTTAETEPIPDHNDKPDTLRAWFKTIVPDHDEDKVHINDIRKVIKWYNFLRLHAWDEVMTESEEGKEQGAGSEEE